MRYLFTTFACLVVTAGVAGAQDEKPQAPESEKPSPFKTLKERASYGIGRNLAAQIKYEDQLDLDFDIVIQGFTDSLKDKELKMTDRQIQDAMVELGQQMRAKAEEQQKAVAEKNKLTGAEFLAKNAKREGVKTTESGLQYEIIKEGEGKVNPKPTDTVTTHYHGTLLDGTVFDSSVKRGKPIDFKVNQVIAGWTEALQLMNVGDKYKLYIPSELAYGERGAGQTIGPNSTLIFEVELLGINGEKE
jgi:FKBP-type peptidyl-prolyl cis-trans isomerase FklB